MAKVHLVERTQVFAARTELEGATPIAPLSGTVFVRIHAPTTDEMDLPWEGSALALHPDAATDLAEALLQAVRDLKKTR